MMMAMMFMIMKMFIMMMIIDLHDDGNDAHDVCKNDDHDNDAHDKALMLLKLMLRMAMSLQR